MIVVELYGERFWFDERACNRIILILAIVCIMLTGLLFVNHSHAADDRPIITAPKEGGYEQVPHLGECNAQGCVIMEKITKGGFIHQWVDIKRNGVCDVLLVWKPLDDPTYGRFYSLMRVKSCNTTL